MVDVAIYGGTGYVAAEAIRLTLGHPNFRLRWVVSQSAPGTSIQDAFPHLSGPIGDLCFVSEDALLAEIGSDPVAIIGCMPHGASASVMDRLLPRLPKGSHIVDLSADFRLSSASEYAEVYGHEHPAPNRFAEFFCGLPELGGWNGEPHVANPGCFATCLTLASAPLVAHGGSVGPLVFSGVTGSTGSGASPKPGTHHPTRCGGMWAYEPLQHRHIPEVKRMLSRVGDPGEIWFVPHSGPFARGIHVTLQTETSFDNLKTIYKEYYGNSPFVSVFDRLPSVREVASTNRCHIGVQQSGSRAVITAVIDNLVKGAAGGGIQWLNRLFGFEETAGLWSAGDMWA